MTETVEELNQTLDRADDHTAMLMEQIQKLEATLIKMVETDLTQRVEIESLKIALRDVFAERKSDDA